MTLAEDKPIATQELPLRAGGGRPSRQVEQRTVQTFSPMLQSYFKQIYKSLIKHHNSGTSQDDTPPLESYAEFESWFRTSAASALAPPLKHDLSYPISNYYISSSHNTYLSGNQLYGSASGDAYRNVLIRGCRCLEIDVWDGEDDDTSVSSSDYEEFQGRLNNEKREGRRDRANSALTRMTHRVKDKAQRMRSPNRSPGPSAHHHHHDAKPVEGNTRKTSHTLDIPTLQDYRILKTEPRVYHGYTLTKDIPFRVVCHAIRDSAFEATDLPLIVSLEVHCSLEQQETMVEIMKSVFGGHLVDMSKLHVSAFDKLPAPDELRNKILIKVKWSSAPESQESNDPLEHVQTRESEDPEDNTNPEKKKKAAKIIQALSDLGVYTRAYTFKHFAQPEAKIATHVFSLSEAKVEDIHSDPHHGPALFDHNRNFLMRVFPSGLRVNSSNVEPCFLWRQGAQMVALNWQKLDQGTMLNEGMFGGEEGWVLKPEGFRGDCANHNDERGAISDPKRYLLNLEIELIAAQNLPIQPGKEASQRSKMKPYVKLQLHVDTHGPPGQGSSDGSEKHASTASKYRPHLHRQPSTDANDELARKLKRKSKTSKSSDADFGGELMTWSGIHDVVEELSFLRLKICDDRLGKDELIAWACIKLNRLKTGYRFVHLLDTTGSPCDGVLLLKISKTLHA